MSQERIAWVEAHRQQLENLSAEEVLRWSRREFDRDVVFASSLGAEDQVLIHLIASAALDIRAFTLDTGRIFQETYDLIDATAERYGRRLEIYFPDGADVENMVREHGVNLFYESVEKRKLCCEVRKMRPLRRALSGAKAWICGLRRDQSAFRGETRVLEWDAGLGLVKVNPLWNWRDADVWSLIHEQRVPYNRLHDKNFPSIGCSSCTRAVAPGEDVRAGRWWWEESAKECGLHARRPASVEVRT